MISSTSAELPTKKGRRWELFKQGQTVKSKRELRKDYVKILEQKRKEADKIRGTLPDRQKGTSGP